MESCHTATGHDCENTGEWRVVIPPQVMAVRTQVKGQLSYCHSKVIVHHYFMSCYAASSGEECSLASKYLSCI